MFVCGKSRRTECGTGIKEGVNQSMRRLEAEMTMGHELMSISDSTMGSIQVKQQICFLQSHTRLRKKVDTLF